MRGSLSSPCVLLTKATFFLFALLLCFLGFWCLKVSPSQISLQEPHRQTWKPVNPKTFWLLYFHRFLNPILSKLLSIQLAQLLFCLQRCTVLPCQTNHKVKVLVTQSCLTLYDPMDYSRPGSSVHGVLLARILEWAAIPFSRGSSKPRGQTWVSCIHGRFCTI